MRFMLVNDSPIYCISTFQIPSRQDEKKVYYRDVFDEYLQNHFANTVNKLYCLLYAMRGI